MEEEVFSPRLLMTDGRKCWQETLAAAFRRKRREATTKNDFETLRGKWHADPTIGPERNA